MYGLEAIRVGNGWEIAIVGISIVFTGLTFLSVFIGQIHKLLDLWDNRSEIQLFKKKDNKKDSVIIKLTENQKIVAKQFSLLVKILDVPFSLPRLLVLAEASGVKNPHSNLCLLIKSGIIFPDNEGFHLWDREKFKKLVA